MSLDAIRAEVIRQRGFIRAAETQGTKILAMIDADIAATLPPPPPPVEPPPPPPVTDEPVLDGTRIVYRDSFDQYASATAMGAVTSPMVWPRLTPYPSPITVSQPVDAARNELIAEGAGKALRMKISGVYQQGADWMLLGQQSPGDSVTNYFSYRARMTGVFPASRVVAIKWLMLWHRRATSIRAQFNLHDLYSPGCTANMSAGPATRWQFYDGSTETPCQAMQPRGPWFHEVADGAWHRFTYAYRPHSVAGARDGFARMWIDGTRIIDVSQAAVGVIPAGGDKYWCVQADVDAIKVADGIGAPNDRSVHWGGPHTGADGAPWTLDVDDFVWWSAAP